MAANWREIRFDVDPQASPDLLGSVVDMVTVQNGSIDAIWSSHILEHLYAHEVPLALSEFKRILKPDGFALITCPDLEAVASLILERGLDDVSYTSPAGPITPLDMVFGHSHSIALGQKFMAHNTGFTGASLGRLLVNAGFSTALVKSDQLHLWALALTDDADKVTIQRDLGSAGLDMFDESE
jgi:hypothetical protein